jgi:integrase
MVDRSGEHHRWTGALRPDSGTGRLKVEGRHVAAHRVAWELVHGALPPGANVLPCEGDPACVRVEHLRVDGDAGSADRRPAAARNRRGAGSWRQVGPNSVQLAATAPRKLNGPGRRVYRIEHGVQSDEEAAERLAAFVTEVNSAAPLAETDLYNLTVDAAVDRFLDHVRDEKGREGKTIRDYRSIHRCWFSDSIGRLRVRDVDVMAMDRAFGRMREAGLSRSRMNHARSLYAPFFRWAKQRGMTLRNPMLDFELPTSRYVSRERTPPEVEELCLLLREAALVIPDVAPILVLGAVTGMRRGELAGVRRSCIDTRRSLLTVGVAIDGTRVKSTKTRKERHFSIDAETLAMLQRVCEKQDELAADADIDLVEDPFLFTLTVDGSTPMPPDHMTKRVANLKEHLGIEDKKPETARLEDEALRLFRQPPGERVPGRSGPPTKGGLSYKAIGEQLGRSARWASMAVASAERREGARVRGAMLDFDGSILALRKFTSSELLDAGFNVSMVAHRQGHGPQVLTRHYAKARRTADRKAAQHLGNVVHGTRSVEAEPVDVPSVVTGRAASRAPVRRRRGRR